MNQRLLKLLKRNKEYLAKNNVKKNAKKDFNFSDDDYCHELKETCLEQSYDKLSISGS